jgi:uncharacterized UPF0146 family protein
MVSRCGAKIIIIDTGKQRPQEAIYATDMTNTEFQVYRKHMEVYSAH